MKQKFLLKTMLLLSALVVGLGNVWADEETYTFTSKSWAATNSADEPANWTSGKDGNQLQSGRGIQVTTGVSGANATSPTSISNISKIVVTYSTNASNGAGSIAFQVGSGSEKSQSVTKTGGTSDRTLTYNFSPNETGKVKITVSCTTNSIYVKSVTITYSDVVKEPNELAWSAESKNVTYSEEPYDLPTLTNPHSLAISYDSSDKSVATIDAEGNVTIKNVEGSTTISATTDGDETYASGTASYTLNVTHKEIIEDGIFDFSFSTSYGSDMTRGTVAVNTATWTAINITMGVAGRNCWFTDNASFRLYKANGSDAAGSVTLNCPSGKAITKIIFTGASGLTSLTANNGTYTGTGTSTTWTGAAQSVTFTASNTAVINKITVTYGTTVPVTIGDASWTSFCAGVALDFTGVTAYTVTATSSTSVTLNEITEAPANTPVVIEATEGTHYLPVLESASDVVTNLLLASDGSVTGNGSTIYALGKKDGVVGFYLVESGQRVPEGKAYLVGPAYSGGVKEFLTFDFGGDADGISLTPALSEGEGEIYNLAGQRLNKMQKGINIVNGKKVLY